MSCHQPAASCTALAGQHTASVRTVRETTTKRFHPARTHDSTIDGACIVLTCWPLPPSKLMDVLAIYTLLHVVTSFSRRAKHVIIAEHVISVPQHFPTHCIIHAVRSGSHTTLLDSFTQSSQHSTSDQINTHSDSSPLLLIDRAALLHLLSPQL